MLETIVTSSLSKIFPEGIAEHAESAKSAFCNEPLSFQIAYRGEREVLFLRVESDLPKEAITHYGVGFVPLYHTEVTAHDEHFSHTTGKVYPDPLFVRRNDPPLIEVTDGCWRTLRWEQNEPVALSAVEDCYQALWFTVNEAGETLPPGDHFVTVRFYSAKSTELLSEQTVSFTLLSAPLGRQTLSYTAWFHADCLSDLYGVPMFSDRHFEIMRSFVAEAAKTGMNMILLPAFTPPLDTPVGQERKTAQLVRVRVTEEGYAFDFSLLRRFVKMCQKEGINRFEHSHFFTQWGAKAAPKIMAERDGNEEFRLFGWETDSRDPRYAAFLEEYLQALLPVLEELEVEDVLFHISDEPQEKHLEYYHNAVSVLRGKLDNYRSGDALSHYEFYQKGYVQIPIVATSSEEMDRFVEGCDRLWVYYTGAAVNNHLSNRLIHTTAARNRCLGVQLYAAGAIGFLNWGYNYYYDILSHGMFQPFSDPCGFDKDCGGAYVVYPSFDGTAVPSVRMKVFYEGLNDYRALEALERIIGRQAVLEWIESRLGKVDFHTYLDETTLLRFRDSLNEEIEKRMS